MAERYYIEEDGVPVAAEDGEAWLKWMNASVKERLVGQDEFQTAVGIFRVCTEFEGKPQDLDEDPPTLYATEVERKSDELPCDDYCDPLCDGFHSDPAYGVDRWETRAEAKEGHELLVERIRIDANQLFRRR